MLVHVADQVRVDLEQPVHVRDVAGADGRGQQVRVPEVAVAATESGVVGDVAGGLLQVGHEPAPLQDLGKDVGCLFAGQVNPTQLGHTVVAVLEEDLVVQLLCTPQPDGGIDRLVAGHVELSDELLEEQATEALVGTRVPGEESTLHDLGEVHESEDRLVQVREVATQDVGLVRTEFLGGVGGHGRRT